MSIDAYKQHTLFFFFLKHEHRIAPVASLRNLVQTIINSIDNSVRTS